MSVGSLEEPHQATVPPVQVDPLGNTEAQNHIVLRALSQEKIITAQYIIGLKNNRGDVKNPGLIR